MNLRFLWLAPLFLAAALADSASGALDALSHYESGADLTALRHYDRLVAEAATDPAVRQAVQADFVRVLDGPSTQEAKRFVCLHLAVIGDDAVVPALARRLADPATVDIACFALAPSPSAQAGVVLRRALATHGTAPLARAAIIHALGHRRDAAAVKLIRGFTGDSSVVVADSAIIALGKIANPAALAALERARRQARPELVAAVDDATLLAVALLTQPDQRATAKRMLEELLKPSHATPVRRGALLASLRLDPDGGEQRVLALIAGNDDTLKPVAIAAVPSLKGTNVSARLAAELRNLSPADQTLLIPALAQRGDAESFKAIQRQLSSRDSAVRLAAIAAVGQGGDAMAVPVLVRALASAQDPAEVRAIELALTGLQGGDTVDKALTAQLVNRMAGPKAPILAALVRRANPVAQRVFLSETANGDPAMARLAFQGLGRVSSASDVPAVLVALGGLQADAARDDVEATIGQFLNRVGNKTTNSVAVRAALAQTTIPATRASLVRLLAAAPDGPALDAVKAVLADGDKGVKEAAARTLADWPDAAAWEPLREVYGRAGSEAQRVVALRGLARLLGEQNAKPEAGLVGRYRDLLAGARSDNDRKLILGALGGCTHVEALALALEQLEQPGVRGEAVLAVKQIAGAIKGEHPDAAAAALKKIQ